MKLLTVSVLLFALLALSYAEEAKEEEPKAEEAKEEEAKEAEEEQADLSHVVKRATSCPSGWTFYNSRCFRYFSSAYTWAQAENYCRSQGGNLATAPTNRDYDWLRNFVYGQARSYKLTWIGGSDAQQDRVWFWSDGSRFQFSDWCDSTPRSSSSYSCLAMNYNSRCYCGIDLRCTSRYSFVCVRK